MATTVNRNIGSSDEAGSFGGEKCYGTGHFFRISRTSKGMSFLWSLQELKLQKKENIKKKSLLNIKNKMLASVNTNLHKE